MMATGIILVALGFLIRVLAIYTLGAMFSGVIKAPDKIVMHGIYKHVRHPSYTGGFIMTIGLAMIKPEVAICWLAYSYALSRSLQEEHILSRNEEYIQYKEKTGRFLPRMKLWL